MTLLEAEPTAVAPATDEVEQSGDSAAAVGVVGAAEPVARVAFVTLSAALASLSAAWMATRLFRGGVLPMLVAASGIAIGAGLTWLAHRQRLPVIRLAILPAALIVGAILASTAGSGAGSVPSLVSDALRGGGLREAPIPFDPGWRFLIVVLFALFSAGASSLALGLRKSSLAVAVPVPIAIGAALIQPKGSELVASGVAMLLLIGAMAVSYGADLAADGVVGSGFELRRLLRGVVLMTVIIGASVGLSQADFLFPDTAKDEVIPPMKPPTPPPLPDRELFTVKSEAVGPWRIGVLDVYQDNAFLLPSVDPKRFVKVPKGGELGPPVAGSYTAEITNTNIIGQTLISAPNATRVTGLDGPLRFDPRTQLVKLVETSLSRGARYTVEAPPLPTAKQLIEAPDPRPDVAEFAVMPPPPPGVVALLAKADELATNRFDRLQFVRQALYSNVIAAGGGKPADVPPGRVDDMIAGGEASPYEISAAEVMLARWAGLPARLGYGFYGGERKDDVTSFRPIHGAAWLEAYFEGVGWVPVIGTPPKAKSSLSNDQKKKDPKVVPSDELAISLYVPVRRANPQLLYTLVRFYALRVMPIGLTIFLVVVGYPALFKVVRSRRRRRWAAAHGSLARVAVAYAELRDRCNDLNIGDVRRTPLRFLADVVDDDEHEELAWLVSRASWGDLTRDLRIEDVEAAEEMARSVQKRIVREQSGLMRVLAWVSRASLRDPWTLEVPNTWPSAQSAPRGRKDRRHFVVRTALAAVVVVGVLGVGTTLLVSSLKGGPTEKVATTFPTPLMPPTVLGAYQVERRVALEAVFEKPRPGALLGGGRVFTVRGGDVVHGSVQVAVFKPGVRSDDPVVQRGIEGDLGPPAAFRTIRMGTIHLRVLETAEERIFLWFQPEANAMELFIMRRRFDDAERVVRALVLHQRISPPDSPEAPEAAVVDVGQPSGGVAP